MRYDFDIPLTEIGAVLAGVDPQAIDSACAAIASANKVVLYGCGREALQLRGFAMRLFHIGCDVAMQGDMSAPAVGPDDLFIVSAGPGELSTVTALMTVAKNAGADILFLTAEPDTPSAALANHTLTIPAQTMARDQGAARTSALPMGSVYEGALFMLFEVMILDLVARLGVPPEEMRARHTNLE